MLSAYLLVSHGSRDPRPKLAMEQLAKLISQSPNWVKMPSDLSIRQPPRQTLAGSWFASSPTILEPVVRTACLELGPVPLHEQIVELSKGIASGYNSIQILPLFLLPGTHVMEDIPAEVALARDRIEPKLRINLRPYLGTHPGLSRLLAKQMVTSKVDAWILLAHGSRRAGSQEPIATLATGLGAVPAYWAVAPRLESQVRRLIAAGRRRIGIMPYFLFPGGITDAIAQAVEQLQAQFPTVDLQLAEPLGASAELANLIWDLMEK